MSLLVLVALVPAPGLLLAQQKLLAHSRLACVMSVKESGRGDAQTLTITLTGCGDGIGLGLDTDNRVDLLRPGLPAAKALQLGDKVMQWNGNEMVDASTGERRLLKDVVVRADSHELVVERAANPALLSRAEWESGLTCIEYADEAEGELRLGVFVAYSMDEAEPHIRPLCASSEEDGVGALLCDEGVPPAPISSARRVLDPDVVFVSERQAGGGQGLGNPHGEHGEECFDLRDASVSTGVRVVVREGRDTERVL